MVPTFRPKADYSLRLAKTAERRMIATTLSRLDLSSPIRDYRYVGPWDRGGIAALDFVRTGEEPFRLTIPALTRREALHLLRAAPALPGDIESAAKQAGIPLNDARRFAAAYRYVPRYVEAEDW